jgi:hypothetical protein
MKSMRTVLATGALTFAVLALLASSATTKTTATHAPTVICPLIVVPCCGPPVLGVRAAVLPCCPVPTAGTAVCCTPTPCTAGLSLAAAPDPASEGHSVTLTGTLSSGTVTAQTVDLWQRVAGQAAFTDVANTQTSASGGFTFMRAVTTNAEWYAEAGSVTSPTLVELVRAAVALHASTVRPAVGARLALSGTIAPSHAGDRVALQQFKGRRWVTIARPVVSPASRFVGTQTVHGRPGDRARFRVILAADARNAQSVSPVAKITVR